MQLIHQLCFPNNKGNFVHLTGIKDNHCILRKFIWSRWVKSKNCHNKWNIWTQNQSEISAFICCNDSSVKCEILSANPNSSHLENETPCTNWNKSWLLWRFSFNSIVVKISHDFLDKTWCARTQWNGRRGGDWRQTPRVLGRAAKSLRQGTLSSKGHSVDETNRAADVSDDLFLPLLCSAANKSQQAQRARRLRGARDTKREIETSPYLLPYPIVHEHWKYSRFCLKETSVHFVSVKGERPLPLTTWYRHVTM